MNNRGTQRVEGERQFKIKLLLKLIGGYREDLRERVGHALEFYASYHQNPINQQIHTVCIPLVVWTTMVWLSNVPFPMTENAANLLAIGYCLGYSAYDFKLGASSAVILGIFSYTASLFAKNEHANFAALVLHGAGWAAQIYGHVKFEGNRPALQKSLLESLYIAPLFSLKEACGMMNNKIGSFLTLSVFNKNHKASLTVVKKEITERKSYVK